MKIVIVCMGFARMQHALSLAEGLSLAGHEVDYITAEKGASDPLYTTVTVPFATAAQRVKQAARMGPAASLAAAAHKRGGPAKWLVRTAAKVHEALLMRPDKYRGWISACRKWLRTDPSSCPGPAWSWQAHHPHPCSMSDHRSLGISACRSSWTSGIYGLTIHTTHTDRCGE